MKKKKRPSPLRLGLIAGLLLLLAAAGLVGGWFVSQEREKHAEFERFLHDSALAARQGDVGRMRRLHLDDELMSDQAMIEFFADFTRLDDATIRDIRLEHEGEGYGWLYLPGAKVLRKVSHSESGWYFEGDVVPSPR